MACRCRCVGDIVTADTTCINLGGVGSFVDPLTADPIIDAVLASNVLSCGANGLAVPGMIYDAGQVTTANVAGPAAPGGGVAPVDLVTSTINLSVTNPSSVVTMQMFLYCKQRLVGITYGDCDSKVDAEASINGGAATSIVETICQPFGTLTAVATDGINWSLGDDVWYPLGTLAPLATVTADVEFHFHWVSGAWNSSEFGAEGDYAYLIGIPLT